MNGTCRLNMKSCYRLLNTQYTQCKLGYENDIRKMERRRSYIEGREKEAKRRLFEMTDEEFLEQIVRPIFNGEDE